MKINLKDKGLYKNPELITYWAKRYQKWVFVEKGYLSDGATGAIDIKNSISWWVHDKVKDTKLFADGSACSNLQASWILFDILKSEKRYIRSFLWGVSTLAFGECKRLLNKDA